MRQGYGKKFSQLFGGSGGGGSTIFKGEITQPSDFPTLSEVQIGWEYIINNPAGVSDNDPSKTNTGLTFPDQVFIIWTGSTWAIEGGESLISDNGTDIVPVNPRGYNVGTGQTFKINNVDVVRYTSNSPSTTKVGGIPAGTSYSAMEITTIIDQLLHDYLSPSFSSFSIQSAVTQEVGQKITGLQTFLWAISNIGNVQANSINITDITNSINLITGHSVTSPSAYDFTLYPSGGLENDVAINNIFRIQGTNTQLSVFTRDYTLPWQWRKYWGSNSSMTLTEAQIKALVSQSLSSTNFGNYSFVEATGQYKYFAFQKDLPQPNYQTGFKDQLTGFNVAMEAPYLVNVTNSFGIATDYYVYRTTNIAGGAATIVVS